MRYLILNQGGGVSKNLISDSSTLESSSAVDLMAVYLVRTVDGLFTLALSVIYVVWALFLILGIEGVHRPMGWSFIAALFFMPIIFLLVFFRHRIGTSMADNKPILFCIVSNSAVAFAPAYIYFWR